MRTDIVNALRTAEFDDSQNAFKAVFCFPSSLFFFAGHFPGRPLLPGVFEIEMVRTAFEAVSKQSCRIVEVTKAKFAGTILPDQIISVEAKICPGDEGTRVDAILRVNQEIKANISIILKVADYE